MSVECNYAAQLFERFLRGPSDKKKVVLSVAEYTEAVAMLTLALGQVPRPLTKRGGVLVFGRELLPEGWKQ